MAEFIVDHGSFRTPDGRYDSDAELITMQAYAMAVAGKAIGLTREQVTQFVDVYSRVQHELVVEARNWPTGPDGLPISLDAAAQQSLDATTPDNP